MGVYVLMETEKPENKAVFEVLGSLEWCQGAILTLN
jgi:hypothetical protein